MTFWDRCWELFRIEGGERELDRCRILFYALLLFWFRNTHFESYSEVPRSLYLPVGLQAWLDLPFPDSAWIGGVATAWTVSLVLAMVGLATRVSTWVAFFLGYYLLGLDWSFGNTHHSHHLLVTCLFILAVARCGQFYSIDARLGFRSKPVTDESWAVRLCQLCWCIMFFNAGVAKARHSGWAFFSGENFHNILLITHQWYARDEYPINESVRSLVYHHPGLAGFLGGAGVLVELLVPLAFLSRRRWRYLLVAGIAGLQVGAFLLFYISEFKKITAAYVFWIPFSYWLDRARNSAPPAPAVQPPAQSELPC